MVVVRVVGKLSLEPFHGLLYNACYPTGIIDAQVYGAAIGIEESANGVKEIVWQAILRLFELNMETLTDEQGKMRVMTHTH